MSDRTTTLSDLRQLVANFVDARDWQQFHSPKNLSMSLAIEAAELMEHFQWLTIDQSRAIAGQPEKLTEVSDELADILCYAPGAGERIADRRGRGGAQQNGQERAEVSGRRISRPLRRRRRTEMSPTFQ
jgi:NTP pyrophosphatase (non-canonical NTP hydrolase)